MLPERKIERKRLLLLLLSAFSKEDVAQGALTSARGLLIFKMSKKQCSQYLTLTCTIICHSPCKNTRAIEEGSTRKKGQIEKITSGKGRWIDTSEYPYLSMYVRWCTYPVSGILKIISFPLTGPPGIHYLFMSNKYRACFDLDFIHARNSGYMAHVPLRSLGAADSRHVSKRGVCK